MKKFKVALALTAGSRELEAGSWKRELVGHSQHRPKLGRDCPFANSLNDPAGYLAVGDKPPSWRDEPLKAGSKRVFGAGSTLVSVPGRSPAPTKNAFARDEIAFCYV
jgi:hypothetical protein